MRALSSIAPGKSASVLTRAPSILLQRQCACGQHTGGGTDCDECKKKQSLQRHPESSTRPATAPPIVHEVLRSPGQKLDQNVRNFMEPRFSHDFSGVRVHTGPHAAESARAVGATAYTVGNNIVFDSGHFSPSTNDGRRLLAHELTHVVQQGNNTAAASGHGLEVGPSNDAAELEARSVAGGIDAARPVTVGHQASATVQGDFTAGDAKKAALIGGAVVGGLAVATGIGLGIAALAGAFSSKKSGAGKVEDAKTVESIIEALQSAAEKYKADLAAKSASFEASQFEKQLAAWLAMVDKGERIIDTLPGKDPALKQRLRSAYQNAIQAAVEFASDRLGETKHSVFEKYREQIAEWALPQAQPKSTGDELIQTVPEQERKQLKIITGSVSFDVDQLFSTKVAKTTIPLPKGVAVRFSSETPKAIQGGLKNVAATIIPKPLELDSMMTLTLDLEPYGGEYSAFRFTYLEEHPKKGKATQEVLIEYLGAVGVEGSTKTRMEAPQKKFEAHGFKRASGWTDEDFTSVQAAIAKVPDSILSPVDGLAFARDSVKKSDPSAGGDYNPDTHTITMYNKAFSSSSTRFGKPGEISNDTVRAVEHEIGHAIDLLPLRKIMAERDKKQEALKTAFAQYENPPGSGNYSFPSTEQAKFNTLKAQITTADAAVAATRSESGERYTKDATGTFVMGQGGTAAGSNEFRQAAAKDGSKRITEYSNKEWQEYYAESFSFYISDPTALQRLRPHVFEFFNKK